MPANLGTYFPLLSGINDVFADALFLGVGIAFAIYVWTRFARSAGIRLGLAAALFISILPASAKRPSEIALDVIPTLLLLGAAVALLVIFFRNNYAAYFVVPALLVARMVAWSWLGQGNAALTVQGLLLLILVLGAVLALLLRAVPTAKLPQ
jgi:hypothetical protein